MLLSGATKDFVGLLVVFACAGSLILCVVYIWRDFSRLKAAYNSYFLRSWVMALSSRLGIACTEGSYIPLVAAFLHPTSSVDICGSKRKFRTHLEAFRRTVVL